MIRTWLALNVALVILLLHGRTEANDHPVCRSGGGVEW